MESELLGLNCLSAESPFWTIATELLENGKRWFPSQLPFG